MPSDQMLKEIEERKRRLWRDNPELTPKAIFAPVPSRMSSSNPVDSILDEINLVDQGSWIAAEPEVEETVEDGVEADELALNASAVKRAEEVGEQQRRKREKEMKEEDAELLTGEDGLTAFQRQHIAEIRYAEEHMDDEDEDA